MNRREFVESAARATAFTAVSSGRILGANDRLGLGVIGCGGRGRLVAREMLKAPNTEVLAVCDVYDENTGRASEALAGGKAQAFRDFRRLLELKSIDAILVATPDHWHAIPTVLACQAGKDVLVEKPFSLTVKEGRAMADAARRHNRIVMPATQHRSAPHIAEAARIVQSGEIGEVAFVRVWNCGNVFPNLVPKVPDSDPPPGLDWDLYLGPSPKVPFNRNRFLSRFRQFYDYSGGYITDFGSHRIDSVHQVMAASAPVTVSAVGKRISKENAGDIFDLHIVTYEYPNFVMEYAACWVNGLGIGGRSPGMTHYGMRGMYNRPHGFAFYGTKAALIVDRLGYEIFPEVEPASLYSGGGRPPDESNLRYRADRKSFQGRDATGLHAANFINHVRSRQRPEANEEVGHRSTTACLLGTIAARAGRTLRWNAEREDFENDPEASRLLSREARPPWNII